MNTENKIVIYTNENCKSCQQTMQEIKENNIDFTEKPILEFEEEWGNVVNTTYMNSTPVVLFKDNYFISQRDFMDTSQLIAILKNYEKPTADTNTIVLERIKTLNYTLISIVNDMKNKIDIINRKLG